MSAVSDYSLFPSKEEWGTGDEAMDNRLSIALKKVKEDLTLDHISEFYFYGLSLRPRAYNPSFYMTIEFITKAFLFCLSPDEYNDQLMQKIKGNYSKLNKVITEVPEVETIKNELLKNKKYRYHNQIDFYLHEQSPTERNPFIRALLKRSETELLTKIILKEFKAYLNGEKDLALFKEPFFQGLRSGNILQIEKFAEIWYYEGQIYSLGKF